MACESIKKQIFVDPITKKQGTVEIAKWTGGELVYHVILSGSLSIDISCNDHDNGLALGVTKDVMEMVRPYDYAKMYVTYHRPDGYSDELGLLRKRGMAKGEYNFYYLLF